VENAEEEKAGHTMTSLEVLLRAEDAIFVEAIPSVRVVLY
jgi:hypothetical protein